MLLHKLKLTDCRFYMAFSNVHQMQLLPGRVFYIPIFWYHFFRHDQELSGTQLARARLLMSSIRALSSSKNKSVNEHKQAVSTLRDINHRVRLMR
jgi:hypothetical protein